MGVVDDKRNQRELDIWLSTRGPDFSDHDKRVAARKAEAELGKIAQANADHVRRYYASSESVESGQDRGDDYLSY